MPLIEIASVRLHPSLAFKLPDDFTSTWTYLCAEATKAASGVPFQLFHSTTSADKDLYHLIGGWNTGQDHINFLSTPDAVAMAKSVGQYMTVDTVRHVDGDIRALDSATGLGRPRKLRANIYKVPATKTASWMANWGARPPKTGSGGWDMSGEVQKAHKAFKLMGEVTNSISAFGSHDETGSRTWVWVEDADEDNSRPVVSEDIEVQVLEMECVVG
jgi:hypothetical protein